MFGAVFAVVGDGYFEAEYCGTRGMDWGFGGAFFFGKALWASGSSVAFYPTLFLEFDFVDGSASVGDLAGDRGSSVSLEVDVDWISSEEGGGEVGKKS